VFDTVIASSAYQWYEIAEGRDLSDGECRIRRCRDERVMVQLMGVNEYSMPRNA
jgi:hypothetical protein